VAEPRPAGPGQVRRQQHHGGAAARVLHRGQRPGQPDHAEPEPAEIVPGEPEHERLHVHSAGEAGEGKLHAGRRSHGPGAGHGHVYVAVHHTGKNKVRRVGEKKKSTFVKSYEHTSFTKEGVRLKVHRKFVKVK